MEYEALCPAAYREQHANRVSQLRAQHAAQPSWETNHRFEYILVQGMVPAILQQRVAIYRQRLRVLIGSETAEALGHAFELPKDASTEALRDVALGLLCEIQRLRHVRSEFERLRNRLLVSMLTAGALFGALCFYLLAHAWLAPIAHVLSAGLLGGYFSALLRLGALHWCMEYNANYQQVDRLFWNLLWSLGLSMFEGAVGALVLFTIFVAGLLKGNIFPEFATGELTGVNLSTLWWMVPPNSEQAAKLLVWCILAGFSERLIPDFLSTFSKRLEASSKPAADSSAANKPAQ